MADLRDHLQATLGTAYSVERELGGGGMSRVFVANETSLGRRVVVKVLPPDLSADVSAERFRREMHLIAALRHPHIVPILAAGESGGLLYYTMPFIEGESLRSRLARQGALALPEATRILREVVKALAYAHRHAVVHRDLKPENILLDEDAALVADFGVAKALGGALIQQSLGRAPLTSSGLVLGTPAYMAPEQAAGDSGTDHRADIYALGVVAYEMIAGSHPFAGRAPHALLAAHATEAPEPIARRRAIVPTALAALVMRCLEKHPADRPQTAEDVLRAVDVLATPDGAGATALSSPSPVPSARPPWLEARMRHARAHRDKYVAAILVLSVLLAFFGIAVTSRSISRESALTVRPDSGPTPTVAAAPAGKSVAVLPFANLSADPENEYFADGMTEELISALTKVEGLRVVGRTSSFALKGERRDLRSISEKLGVAAVVDGSVRRAGNRLRVSAQLISVPDGYQLWSERYDRAAADVFAVQDEIARAIVSALQVRLGAGGAALVERSTEDLEAYSLYLQGRYLWNRRTKDGLTRAADYFERAIARDPRFALAYAGLGDSYALLGGPAYNYLPPDEAYPRAKAAALKALEIDSMVGPAYATLGIVGLNYDWDWAAAERAFRQAIQLRPSYATAHHWYSLYLAMVGRLEDAQREIRQAQALDPLSLIINAEVGQNAYYARRYDQAIVDLRRTLEMDPTFARAHLLLALSYLQLRRYDDAIREVREVREPFGGYTEGVLGYAYAVAGRRDDAHRVLVQLRARADREHVSPAFIALVHAGLGDRDQAFAWMDRAYEERSGFLRYLKVDPLFDPLRADPRFGRLMARMRFPP